MGNPIGNIIGKFERILEERMMDAYWGRQHQTIGDFIKDNFNYIKAQIVYWEYRHRDNYCTACGIAGQETLDAMLFIFDFKNRKNQKSRRENEEDSLMD